MDWPKEKYEMIKYINYLDELRDSGITNMWGAAPYLKKAFKIKDEKRASKILVAWMKSFERGGDASIRADAALKEMDAA